VGRTGRFFSYGVAISFFQENEENILDEIKQLESGKKIIPMNFDEDGLNCLQREFGINNFNFRYYWGKE
jgi:superfamily II DNA/RNA helicase